MEQNLNVLNSDIKFESLLAKTQAFMNTMYWVKKDFGLTPKKDHIGTCINYSDLVEMRIEFLREMVASIIKYVYSTEKQNLLRKEFINEGRDESDSSMMLAFKAKSKFRCDDLRGQFSELLLFNLLQYHFKAIPLVRKMSITTNPKLERNGADAIHIANLNGEFIIYLGEAKTYNRNQGSLRSAIKDAIKSIIEHYKNHRNELNLYAYDDFIPIELEKLAKDYLGGRINLEVQLVSMISYNNKAELNGSCRTEILESIMKSIEEETKSIQSKIFSGLPSNLYPRFNYIIFPINEMDSLLNDFKRTLGV